MADGKSPFEQVADVLAGVPMPEGQACGLSAFVQDWDKRSDNDPECPPCVVATASAHYIEVLREQGLPDLAERVEKGLEPEEGVDVVVRQATLLDAVKTEVSPELRAYLCEMDNDIRAAAREAFQEAQAAETSLATPEAGGENAPSV